MTPDTNPGKGGSEGARRPHRLKREVVHGGRSQATFTDSDAARATGISRIDLQALREKSEIIVISPDSDGMTTIYSNSKERSISPKKRRARQAVEGSVQQKSKWGETLLAYKLLVRILHNADEIGREHRTGKIQVPDSLLNDEQIGPILGLVLGGRSLVDTDLDVIATFAEGLYNKLPPGKRNSLDAMYQPDFFRITRRV